jgi:hypothetical protein
LTREWKQIGSLSGGKSTGKVLTVSTPGSAYFPFKCNWCDIVGHKAQNCPNCLAGKPKAKKNAGHGGGGGGGGKKSMLSPQIKANFHLETSKRKISALSSVSTVVRWVIT